MLYPEVLFDKPINPMLKPVVLIVGGEVGSLNNLDTAYQILSALDAYPELIVPSGLSKLGVKVPAKACIELQSAGQINKAILKSQLDDANLLVLAPFLPQNSTNQIACDYMFENCTSPVIITDEALRLARLNPTVFHRTNTIFLISSHGLIDLANYQKIGVSIRPDRGVFNKIDIIKELQGKFKSDFIVYDKEQILVCSRDDVMGIVDTNNVDILARRGVLLGLMSGLLADSSSKNINFFKRAMTAGYIFKVTSAYHHDAVSLIDNIKMEINREN